MVGSGWKVSFVGVVGGIDMKEVTMYVEDEGDGGLYSGLVGGEGNIGLVGEVGLTSEFEDLKGGMCNIIGTEGAVTVGLGATGGGTRGSGDVEIGSTGMGDLEAGRTGTAFTGGTNIPNGAFCASVGDLACCTGVTGTVLEAGSAAGFTC